MQRGNVIWIVPLCLALLLFFLVQFSQPTIIGADGHLHGRLTQMILEKGFLRSLPQAHFSWFATKFSDKDFVYHLFLLPFVSFFGYEIGTKLGAFIATSALVCVVFYLLRYYGKSYWISWFGLTLLLSAQFIRDTAEGRPFVFALLLTILGIHVLILNNVKLIFLVSVVYGAMHLSAWILPLTACTFFMYDWLQKRNTDFRPVCASTLGWGSSFLLHPNFPNNLYYFYLNGILVPFYAAKTGVLELGAEFFPLYTSDILRLFPVVVIGGIVIVLLRSVGPGKMSRETSLWLVAVLIFIPLGFVAKRNMTHMYPIAVIFLGCILAETFRELQKVRQEQYKRTLIFLGTIGGITLIYGIWQTATSLSTALFSEQVYSRHFASAASVLRSHAKSGSRVFHTNWSDSQYLIGLAPEFEYFVTLDPIYMYSYNKELYSLYRSMSFGKSKDPYTLLSQEFGATYGYAGKNYFIPLIEQVRRDSRFDILGEDDLGIVFALKPKH